MREPGQALGVVPQFILTVVLLVGTVFLAWLFHVGQSADGRTWVSLFGCCGTIGVPLVSFVGGALTLFSGYQFVRRLRRRDPDED